MAKKSKTKQKKSDIQDINNELIRSEMEKDPVILIPIIGLFCIVCCIAFVYIISRAKIGTGTGFDGLIEFTLGLIILFIIVVICFIVIEILNKNKKD